MKRSDSPEKRHCKGVWIPIEIWTDTNLSLIEKTFFIEIDSLDGPNGCFASNKYFAKFFNITPGRCSQIINSLQKKGYVEIELFYKGKQIIKRVVKVFNKLKRGSKFIKEGYIENDKDNNTIYNNIIKDISIQDEKIIDSNKKHYICISKKLAKIISTHKKINCNQNINNWIKPIKLLMTKDLKINGTKFPQIKKRVLKALKYYGNHIGEKYTPVIQSGDSFRKKFIKLEDAMGRENNNYKKETKEGLSQEEANVVKRKTIKI